MLWKRAKIKPFTWPKEDWDMFQNVESVEKFTIFKIIISNVGGNEWRRKTLKTLWRTIAADQ